MILNSWKWIDDIKLVESGVSAKATKRFDPTDSIFRFHFPSNPIVPGVLHVEMIAQVASACMRDMYPGKTVVLSKIKSGKFFRPLRPGEDAEIFAEILSHKSGCANVQGRVEVGGRVYSSVHLQLAVLELSSQLFGWGEIKD